MIDSTDILIQCATLQARIDELDAEIDEASNAHRDLVQLQNDLQRELDKLSERLDNDQ
jgi:regulator of replication initiation timing